MVEEKLKNYKKNQARLKYLKNEIKKTEIQIDMLNDALKNAEGIELTDDETIEMLTFRRVMDGLPIPSSFDGSKTERTAMLYKKIQEELKRPPNKREIKVWIEEQEKILERYKQETQYLELELNSIKALLKVLNAGERFVVYQRYVESQPWQQVTELYNEQFTPPRDERTLKNYAEKAVEKLETIIPP